MDACEVLCVRNVQTRRVYTRQHLMCWALMDACEVLCVRNVQTRRVH